MLAIRFLRTGRRNRAFFRIVLTESSRPPKSNYIKELGWFDPHSKESSLKSEEILKYLNTGAKPSNSVAKLLIANNIKHKHIVYTPDAPKAKRGKGDEKEVKTQQAPSSEAQDEVSPDQVAEPTEATDEKVAEQTETPAENTVKEETVEEKEGEEVTLEAQASIEKSEEDSKQETK